MRVLIKGKEIRNRIELHSHYVRNSFDGRSDAYFDSRIKKFFKICKNFSGKVHRPKKLVVLKLLA